MLKVYKKAKFNGDSLGIDSSKEPILSINASDGEYVFQYIREDNGTHNRVYYNPLDRDYQLVINNNKSVLKHQSLEFITKVFSLKFSYDTNPNALVISFSIFNSTPSVIEKKYDFQSYRFQFNKENIDEWFKLFDAISKILINNQEIS